MILADSSIWIDYLRANDAPLAGPLNAGLILMHPFVVGEVGLGSLRERNSILRDMRRLPAATVADDAEVQMLIERVPLHGRGIGYIDAHLLASVRLTPGAKLWSRDRRLDALAGEMGIAAQL